MSKPTSTSYAAHIYYQDPDLKLVHEYAEAWSYYLIQASAVLAAEKGACLKSDETKYHDGVLPIDTYKNTVDELAKPDYKMNWDELRSLLKEVGIRNSTLMALMPAETSAQISNSTPAQQHGTHPAGDPPRHHCGLTDSQLRALVPVLQVRVCKGARIPVSKPPRKCINAHAVLCERAPCPEDRNSQSLRAVSRGA